ncbi:MAG: hypothetical protein ACE15F_14335 [bacterium]
MARGKKSRKPELHAQALTELQPSDVKEHPSEARTRFTIYEYIAVCLFFIAFCYVQKYVALYWLGALAEEKSLEKLSLSFFFDTLWKGFVLVALLAWLHDYFYRDVAEEDTA